MSAFDKFVDGYRRFKGGAYHEQRARWTELAEKQSPKLMVIACSDSRVDPTMVFDSAPGEMFVVRNVANLVPPFESGGGRHGVSAAIEFAVTQLKVEEIVVMGHARCGGVGACLSQVFAGKEPGEGGFVEDWVQIIREPRDRIHAELGDGADAVQALELEAIRTSIENLRTFPFVPPREEAGELKLRGAYFDITNGGLQVLDQETGEFSLVS